MKASFVEPLALIAIRSRRKRSSWEREALEEGSPEEVEFPFELKPNWPLEEAFLFAKAKGGRLAPRIPPPTRRPMKKAKKGEGPLF
jgi:hypothetical protein